MLTRVTTDGIELEVPRGGRGRSGVGDGKELRATRRDAPHSTHAILEGVDLRQGGRWAARLYLPRPWR